MTGVPLDLGEAEVETTTPATTSTPVVPTPSLAEGLPAMRMIPTPGSRVQSSETSGARTQITTPTETTTHTPTEDDEPPPPEPDPMPWPLVDNPLPEGEEEDVALEEELARQAGRVYLRWDGVGIRYAREYFKKLKQVNKRNRASSTGGSLQTRDSTTYEATRERIALELGRTPTQSEVFARTPHTEGG
ncbi:hypothetical protein PIB30_068116 [Stylosanthes scabra]|uniref:Uncharacterized protein n=1 Tax=Stylosanthes scabra TaxID=79078 RepID=A0ABU6RN77_9FABA|nr:hypothetical protein [Stylosanthes scabra]